MLTLKKIDRENYGECLNLEVDESQKGFVSSNVLSLAKAYAYTPDSDRKEQGQGYGRKALNAVLDQIRQEGRCKDIIVSCKVDNHNAMSLYKSVGFTPLGDPHDGEADLILHL